MPDAVPDDTPDAQPDAQPDAVPEDTADRAPDSQAAALTFPDNVPVLSDGVVTLRAHTSDDIDAVTEQAQDPASQRWTSVPRPYERSDAVEFLQLIRSGWNDPEGNRIWAIDYSAGDGTVHYGGTIDLRPKPYGVADIGFALHPAARGKSVMSRAVRLACRYAFETGFAHGPVQRIHWEAYRGNWASRRVAWATGFTMHGTVPQLIGLAGVALEDAWLASLGRDDRMEPTTNWLEAVTLEADGIRLREWRDSDRDSIEDMVWPAHHLPEHAKMTDDTFTEWVTTRRERMASGQGIYWCIADAETDLPLGLAILFDREGTLGPLTGEVGYWLYPRARGRGVMGATMRLLVEHAFTPESKGGLGLRRLTAGTAADNEASNSVLRRAGFEVWGREPAVDELPDGTLADGLHWYLLAP